MAFKTFLSAHTVDELPKPAKGVVVIDSKATLIEAFETLINHNIQSAPVLSKADNTFTGFLDIRDLVSFVVYVYDSQNVADNNSLHDIIRHGVKMFNTPTTDGVTVSYLSRRNRFVPVKQTETIFHSAELLAQGLHRVPVVDAQGHVVNIISQSSIIQYLAKHLKEIGVNGAADKTVEETKLGSHPVVKVDKNVSVIETLRTMDKGRRSGVAIVDGHNRLVGTTTGKDLGLFIKHPTLAALNSHIHSFLSEVRQQQTDIRNPTMTVFGRDHISRVISVLAATKVHRLFVADSEEKFQPVAVISITDLLNYFIKHH